MARLTRQFVCQACGAVHRRWAGRCEACGAWNTITEESPPSPEAARGSIRGGRALTLSPLSHAETAPLRVASGIAELDRVLGGGLVPASALLIGGDPGIGKSTLLLQASAAFARAGLACLYISGEEAAAQVRLRAQRLGLADAPVHLGASTALGEIIATLQTVRADFVVIDSIQTLWLETLDAAPGSVAQVRAAAHELVALAKRRGFSVVLVGHVTKDGQIAGPRVVEHLVDCVLYFEGERGHPFRILRAVKNRFGPADEIGVFEMTGSGLTEVANPSALFLSGRGQAAAGSVVFAGIEGTRPVLTEIQALVVQAPPGQARRMAVGLETARLATILAVLEARCGLSFAGLDVFVNVAGGLRISEPAADLALATALVSAREDVPMPPDTVVFGEISLSGALRPVAQTESRLKEAAKLGFTTAIVPEGSKGAASSPLRLREMAAVSSLVGELFGAG